MPILAALTLISAIAPDRSAEPQLKALFEKFSKLQNLHAMIVAYDCDSSFKPLEQLGTYELWRKSDRVFRVQFAGLWGDSWRRVGDGTSLSLDVMDASTPIVLSDMVDGQMSSQKGLEPGDEGGLLFWAFLDGPNRMAAVVPPDAFITASKDGTISFGSRKLGSVFVRAIEPHGLEIRYDQRVNWGESGPAVGPTEDHTILQTMFLTQDHSRFPRDWFSTDSKSKHPTSDQRKKKG